MSSYRYAGVPLSPAVFASAIPEVCEPGETISRKDLIERVAQRHQDGGGLPATSPIGAAKKALNQLTGLGVVVPISQGYWRVIGADGASSATELMEVGEGEEIVYAYYFPAYRDQAAYLGRSEWPMKIGMTKGEVALRLTDQIGTAMPERPMVGLIYRSDDASTKEWFLTSLAEIKSILDFATGQVTQV